MINNPYKQYKQTQIETADQGKLIVMLYDGAIRFLTKAIDLLSQEKLKGKDIEEIHNNIIKTQDIITELMSSLNMEVGEISQRLFSIYMYMNNRLIEGNIKKDKAPLIEVRNHLSQLRDAWEIAAKNVSKEEMLATQGVNIAT